MRLNGQASENQTVSGTRLYVEESAEGPGKAYVSVCDDDDSAEIWLTHRQTIALRDKLTEILGEQADTADATERPEIEDED